MHTGKHLSIKTLSGMVVCVFIYMCVCVRVRAFYTINLYPSPCDSGGETRAGSGRPWNTVGLPAVVDAVFTRMFRIAYVNITKPEAILCKEPQSDIRDSTH